MGKQPETNLQADPHHGHHGHGDHGEHGHHHDDWHPDGRVPMKLKLDIDYSKFDDRFDNRPHQIGPEFGSLEEQRLAYIRDAALTYEKPVEHPLSFGTLEPMRFKKSPATRSWYRRVSGYERNGFLNLFTQRLGLKMKYWAFYPFVLWGFTNHVFQGMYFDEFDFERESDMKVYDKLAHRPLPFARVWSRPG